ncbi:MAG: hypothetical protein JXA99_07180, partial [Candidatus Lokiarchaeota archaeon]|nr:hypothetical protein [Candidatus Lokiarchaeota archaeon]
QLRALCIENKRYKENYTAQILLGKLGKKDLVEEIDNMLNENFRNILKFNPDGIEAEDISIRDAIKTLADEFICHYDNFDGAKVGNLSIYQVIFNQLRNPYEKVNLDYIMNILIKCIHKGFLSLYEGLHGNLNNNK